MTRLLTLASLFLISVAQRESFGGFEGEDELVGCFLRLACIHDKSAEFVKVAEEAGPENHQAYVDAVKKVLEKVNVDIPGNDFQFWMTVKEKGCETSKEEQRAFFLDVSATNAEYLLDICTDPDSELCIKGQVAMDKLGTVLAKYKAIGLCPASEELDKIETPLG